MQYQILVNVDYAEATDEAALLQDVTAIITKAFNERSGVTGFRMGTVTLEP